MKNNKKILAAVLAAIVVLACVVVVVVNNNETTSTMNNSSSMSEISSDVNSNESKDESSESIIIGTAPDDEGNKDSGNGNVIDFPSDDDKSSSSEDVANSTSKEDASTSKEETSESKTESSTSKEETSSSKEESTTKPENSTSKEETSTSKEETSSSSESVTTPEENSSSSEVIVPPVEDDPTPSNPGWSGGYDNLPSDGFDHIKVPTIDDFYDEGLDNPGGAFDFGNRPEWEEEWYDAYNEFLVANDSPIHPDTGIPIPAFYAVNPGSTFINGATYQYLYYGFRGDATNGWGDVVLLPVGLNSSMANNPNYDGAYVLETTNFTYGNMDKGLENEYRAATTMMLSWIVPNPQEVEKAIYDTFVEDHCVLYDHTMANGCGSWLQIGEIDVTVVKISPSSETYMFAFREHK